MQRARFPSLPSPHALGLAQLVAWGATFYALPPLLPRIMADIEVSATSLSVAMSAGLGLSAFGSLAVGAWIQRHGARAPMVGGTLLATLALSGMALSTSAGGVLVSLGLLGVTNAALLYEPTFAAVGTHTLNPIARVRAIQLISFWGGWAASWAIPAATLLSDAWGWRAALLSLASLLLLLTLPIHWRLPPAHAAPYTAPHRTAPCTTHPPFRLIAGFAVGACATGAILVHGILILLERGVDPDTATLVLALMAPVQVAARTWLLRRRGRLASHDHVLPFALIASGLGALLAAPRTPALVLFVVLFGAGNGLLTPLRAALVATLVPAEQLALQLGVMNLAISLARAAAPMLGAATYTAFGFHGAVLSLILLAIAGALLVSSRQPRPRLIASSAARSWRRVVRAVLVLVALAACAPPAPPVQTTELAPTLRDTGLYADWATKTVAAGRRPFTPQYPLWTDGAAKRRWIQLPAALSIDASDPDAWQLPVGTRLWKELTFGRRVETRYMERTLDGWRYATYVWNDDESEATLAPARGALASAKVGDGLRHVIPSEADCRVCHGNGSAAVLGFSALQLSIDRDPGAPHAQAPAAGALDLDELLATGSVHGASAALRRTPPRIEAHTPTERAALGYLHGNCGGCHAPTGSAASLGLVLAYSLEAEDARDDVLASVTRRRSHFLLPGEPSAGVHIAPGDPSRSVLLSRMRSRQPLAQMPPLGTRLIDDDASNLIARWIFQLADPTPKGEPQ